MADKTPKNNNTEEKMESESSAEVPADPPCANNMPKKRTYRGTRAGWREQELRQIRLTAQLNLYLAKQIVEDRRQARWFRGGRGGRGRGDRGKGDRGRGDRGRDHEMGQTQSDRGTRAGWREQKLRQMRLTAQLNLYSAKQFVEHRRQARWFRGGRGGRGRGDRGKGDRGMDHEMGQTQSGPETKK